MRLERTVYERLRAYADEKGQNYTVAVERIITAYLNEQTEKATAEITGLNPMC